MFSFRLNFNRFVSNGKRDDRSYSLPLGTGPAYSSGRNSTASNISSIVHDPSPSPHLDSTAACEYLSYAFFTFFPLTFSQNYSHLFQNLIVKIRKFLFTQKKKNFFIAVDFLWQIFFSLPSIIQIPSLPANFSPFFKIYLLIEFVSSPVFFPLKKKLTTADQS